MAGQWFHWRGWGKVVDEALRTGIDSQIQIFTSYYEATLSPPPPLLRRACRQILTLDARRDVQRHGDRAAALVNVVNVKRG